MKDYIVRATAAGETVRAFAIRSTNLTAEARELHHTFPVVTAALGRLLSAGAMMGSMMKGDNENTEMYYNKILEYHPDDPLALSNIGGFYVQQHKYDEAMGIFKKANESDPSLLNAYHGLALCYYNKRDYQNAFSTCIDGLKKGTNRPQDGDVRSHLQNLTMSVAHKMVDGFDFSSN